MSQTLVIDSSQVSALFYFNLHQILAKNQKKEKFQKNVFFKYYDVCTCVCGTVRSKKYKFVKLHARSTIKYCAVTVKMTLLRLLLLSNTQ